MKLKLKQETLDALDASILHWTNYAEGRGEQEGIPEAENCALCELFFNTTHCHGCPVRLTTGEDCCTKTPFRKAYWAYRDSFTSPAFLSAAREELNFLISIRDNSELDPE